MQRYFIVGVVLVFTAAVWRGAAGADLKPIHLHPAYDHTKYLSLPGPTASGDLVRRFRAYTVVFDGPDDDDHDGQPDALGSP